jgi:lipopolysaccharide export system protein LptA
MNWLAEQNNVPCINRSVLSFVAAGLMVVWCAFGAARAAWAEQADRDKPTHIEADTLRYDERQQQSTFTGKVVATKGTIVMRGAQLQVRQDADGNSFGTLTGQPGQRAFFRQKREGVKEYIEGESDTLDYDGKANVVRLTGHAELRRLAGAALLDQALGSVIVYDNVTEVYPVDGQPHAPGVPSAAPSGRVRVIMAPTRPASAASGAAPAAALRPAARLPAGVGK